MGKKILIIGNGFDLEHGLPTRYENFLEFSKDFCNLYECFIPSKELLKREDCLSRIHDLPKPLKEMLVGLFSVGKYDFSDSECISINDSVLKRLHDYLLCNFWFDYMYRIYDENMTRGIGWIDFESEMSEMIQWMDETPLLLDHDLVMVKKGLSFHADSAKKNIFTECLNLFEDDTRYEELIDLLYDQLEEFIKAMDLFFYYFIEKIPVAPKELFQNIDPDYIISFNYTHTFEKLYANKKDRVCYIHGECSRDENDNNIVLGIDEYLKEDERDEKINMAIFKKFVQRIRNGNDSRYRIWKYDLRYELDAISSIIPFPVYRKSRQRGINIEVYIYGHSLGASDKDILIDFLKPDNMIITDYPYNKVEEGKHVSRMIKIIGEDVLINKSTDNPPRLKFNVMY